ncbi:MAG: O-sialoglycoprotein endopeptidase [Anaerovoracaceae bacterium]|jgi:N6-L-threonylcarbamoyladenine synthase
MAENRDCVLGIDTSNYTTSAAVVSREGSVIINAERLLSVKHGERGLRQSDALFGHMENLPDIIGTVLNDTTRDRIAGIAVSDKPRPVEGSYMPVFRAGETAGVILGNAYDVPVMRFSHQEGHIAAIKEFSELRDRDRVLFYHLSGGTTELLKVTGCSGPGMDTEIIGHTLDISAGQLIDRTGVALGFDFPAGRFLDDIAVKSAENGNRTLSRLTPVKVKESSFNLSGIETQAMRLAESGESASKLAPALLAELAECLAKAVINASGRTGIDDVIFGGGVSCSRFIRGIISEKLPSAVFGEYSSDNAVGTAMLGRKALWPL